jgi:hypothetical protein
VQLNAGSPLAYAWHLEISKSESCPCGQNERLATFNRCTLLLAGLLGGLPTHGTWRCPIVSHVPVDKMRRCVPSTGVRLTGGSGGRPRAMRWALVSEREAPTAAKAAKMMSTSVNCMVKEADECQVLGGKT